MANRRSGNVAPSEPRYVVAVVSPHTIDLMWKAPLRGRNITYQPKIREGSMGLWSYQSTTKLLHARITKVAAGTRYEIEIRATNPMGTSISAIIQVTTPAAGVAPGPATGLTITNITSSSMTVSWTAPSVGTTPFTYQLQMEGTGQQTFSNVGLSQGATSQVVAGLAVLSSYTFQVVTTNTSGTSTSGTVTGTTPATLPGAPTGLLVAGSPQQTSVALSWTAPTVGTQPLTYTVSIATPTGRGNFVAYSTATQSTSLTVTALTAGTSYDFEVTASNTAGSGPASSILSDIVTPSSAVAPSVPQSVTAVPASSTSVTVSWAAPAQGSAPITYVVGYRVTGTNPFTSLASVSTLTEVVTGLTPGTSYDFVVTASNSVSSGPASTPVTAATPIAPNTPQGVTAVAASSTSVTVSWTASTVGTAPVTYVVAYRVAGTTPFTSLGAVSGTSETVGGLTPGTNYNFEVTAQNSVGNSPASTIANALTPIAPTAPTGVGAVAASSTSATVSWTPPTIGTTPITYIVAYRVTGTTIFTSLASVTASPETVTGLTQSTSYDFEVTASNSVGSGPASTIATVVTPATQTAPSVPTSLSAPTIGTTTVNLTWTASTGTAPIAYQTQYSLTGANTWVNGPSVTTTSAQVAGLTSSTGYDFRVTASNSVGTSSPSSVLSDIVTQSATPTVTWQTTGTTDITLSNANKTATAGGSTTAYAQEQGCISSLANGTGSYWFEVTLSALTQNISIGLCNSTYSVGVTNAGADTNSIGFYPSTGPGSQPAQTAYYNNAQVLTPSGNAPASDVGGAIFTFLVNINSATGAGTLFVTGPAMEAAYGASAWNDFLTANPGANTGGIPFTISGTLSILFETSEGGGIAVLNAGSSVASRTIPSQYGAWNGAVITIVAPTAPTALTLGTVASTTVALSWTAPATGTPPLTYTVQQSPHSAGTWTNSTTTNNVTSATVTGLTASTAYDFRVLAGNSAGTSAASGTVTATTLQTSTLPGAPSGVSATANSTTQITVTWQPPTTGGPVGGAVGGYQVFYRQTGSGTWISVGSLSTGSAPSPAAAVGYNTQTFGPATTLAANPTLPLAGANWAPFTFFGVPWMNIVVTTNADGSLTMTTGNMGDSYGGQLCTAVYDATQTDYFRGVAFGGGAFFEATISFTGTPNITGVSFWANDIESMAGGSEGDLTRRQWPSQAAGYGDWIELDFPEFDTGSATQYGQGIHNFYGTAGSPQDVNTGSYPGFVSPITVPGGTDFSQPHKYGFLWVPATASAQGSAQWFFDDVQVGTTVHWNQYNAANAPPPVQGTSAYSIMDTRHFALILGLGSSSNPMTIHAVSVWQASASSNKTS